MSSSPPLLLPDDNLWPWIAPALDGLGIWSLYEVGGVFLLRDPEGRSFVGDELKTVDDLFNPYKASLKLLAVVPALLTPLDDPTLPGEHELKKRRLFF